MATREVAHEPLSSRLRPYFRSFSLYGLEMLIFLGFLGLYFFLRGIAPDRVDLATNNALRIIDIERALGIYREVDWQRSVINNESAINLANFMYLYMHLPFLALIGLCFFHSDRRKHRVLRNAILLSAFLGVPFYHLIPVTPPRLMELQGVDLGFVDTLESSRRPRPGPFVNWYAAIPSYHFGWIALAAFGVFWVWKSAILRALGVAFAALMWWSIVVTANHYFLDMALGLVIVAGALWLAWRWEIRAERAGSFAQRRFYNHHGLRLPF